MVKANAYGHGAPAIATALSAQGTDAFGVATLEEGVELRRAGIRQPVIVLAGAYVEQLDQFVEHHLIPVVHDAPSLEQMEAAVQSRGTTLNVHLKIDTGMGRIGFLPQELDSWLPSIKKLTALKVEGIFSHFSHAESVHGNYTQKQLEIFQTVIARLRELYDPLRLVALAALVSDVFLRHGSLLGAEYTPRFLLPSVYRQGSPGA